MCHSHPRPLGKATHWTPSSHLPAAPCLGTSAICSTKWVGGQKCHPGDHPGVPWSRDKSQGRCGWHQKGYVGPWPMPSIALGPPWLPSGANTQITGASARDGAELCCVWLRGLSGPGLVAAGLWSHILPSCECSGALPCCQLGSKGTNQMQPVGFLASGCHLLLFSPRQPVLGLPVQPALLEPAGDTSREMPFCPQQRALSAPCDRLSAREQPRNAGRHRLVLPGLAPGALAACPGVLGLCWRLLPNHGDTAGVRCPGCCSAPRGVPGWVQPWGVWRGDATAGQGLLLPVG